MLENFLSKIKQPWGLMRILRLAIALIIGIDAWHSQSWGLMFFAAIFLYQSLFNAGCSTCRTPAKPDHNQPSTIEVDYEEVK